MNAGKSRKSDNTQSPPFKKILTNISHSQQDSHISSKNVSNHDFSRPRISAQPHFNTTSKYFDRSQDFAEKTVFPFPTVDYDPKQSPPDISKAVKHGIAHRIAPTGVNKSNEEICESTGMPVNYARISLNCSEVELYYLGPAIPMYFQFIKQMVIFFTILSILPIIFFTLNGETFISDYESVINSIPMKPPQLIISVLFPLFLCIVLMVVLYFFRKSQKITKLSCKKNVITPSDYTLMCSNMGPSQAEDEVKKFFATRILLGYTLDVVKAVVTYDIKDYTEKVREFTHITQVNQGQVRSPKIMQIDQYFVQNIKNRPKHQGLKRNGLCFVTFNGKQEAKSVRRKLELSIFELFSVWFMHKCMEEFPENFFRDNFIKVEKAPELYEIVWENLDCNKPRRWVYLIIAIIIIGYLSVIYALISMVKKSNFQGSTYIIALIIAISNEIIQVAVPKLAGNERFKTITKLQIGIGYRLSIIQFFNMAIPIFILDSLVQGLPLSELANDTLAISLITSLLPVLIKLINFQYIIKRLQRRNIINQRAACKLTQAEANHIFEDPEFEIWLLYPLVIRTMLFNCLYASISPCVVLVALITQGCIYWIDKYNLLRRSLLPTNMRSELSEALFEFVDFGVFLVSLGVYILVSFLPNDLSTGGMTSTTKGLLIAAVFGIVLTGIYMIIPNKRISRALFSEKKPGSNINTQILYQQASDYLQNDYETANPVHLDTKKQRDLKVVYAEILDEMKGLNVLQSSPELLPIFDYARRRPHLYQVWDKKHDGLDNPYYFFPQSYSYSQLPVKVLDSPAFGEKDIESSSIKKPLLAGGATTHNAINIKNDQTAFGNTNKSGNDTTMKFNSIMHDIKMINNFGDKDGEENKGESFIPNDFSGSFGAPPVFESARAKGALNTTSSPILTQNVNPIDKHFQDISLISKHE